MGAGHQRRSPHRGSFGQGKANLGTRAPGARHQRSARLQDVAALGQQVLDRLACLGDTRMVLIPVDRGVEPIPERNGRRPSQLLAAKREVANAVVWAGWLAWIELQAGLFLMYSKTARAQSATRVRSIVPMLTADPSSMRSAARMVPSTISDTWVQLRICSPVPQISKGS